MKFLMIANGNRDCHRSDLCFEAKNISEAKKKAVEYFDVFLKSEEVENITLFRIDGEWEIDRATK